MRFTLAPLALVTLTACGVTTPASPILGPTAPQVTTNGVGNLLDGTVPGSGLPIITFNGTTLTGVAKLSSDGSTFGMAQAAAADGTSFDVIAFSDDGKATPGAVNIVSATVIATSSNATGAFGQRAVYRRDSSSVLPISGTGIFTGDYRGTVGANGELYMGHTAGAPVAIIGDVTLTANFGGKSISGLIDNRMVYLVGQATGSGLANVTLGASTISGNGQYAGTATSNGQTGSYEGLVGGASGTGMAGSLGIDQVIGGITFSELGVFTAIRQ